MQVANRYFPEGCTYRSLIPHEFGHVVANTYGIEPMEVAKEIFPQIGEEEILHNFETGLSKYSSEILDGTEFISEAFASAYGSDSRNTLALQFVESCSRIINKEGA